MAITLALNALCTLQQVKDELTITVATSDDLLTRLINAMSEAIERYCEQSFFFEKARKDKLPGFSTSFLIVDKTPLKVITQITFDDGAPLLSDNFEIHDPDAGLIFRRVGFVWTAVHRQEITVTPLPGQERKLFEVTYDGGFVTQQQDDDNAFPAPNDVRDLPFDIEDAAIQAVTSRFRKKGRDGTVKSEKLMSWGTTYDTASTDPESHLPAAVRGMLNPYKRLAAA